MTTETAAEHRAISPAIFGDERRKVYPFSVIRGGAFSKEELLRAVASDPVAESHYAAFQMDRLHAVQSPFVTAVYVSYRKDNVIYWTSHPIALHDGETVLTDGNLFARARCGNRISVSPQQPVAQMEPAPGLLDAPDEVEALPESLVQAVAQIEPTPAPLMGPENLASPISNPAGFAALGEQFFFTFAQVLRVPKTTPHPVKPAPPGGSKPVEPPVSIYPPPASGYLPPVEFVAAPLFDYMAPATNFAPPLGTPIVCCTEYPIFPIYPINALIPVIPSLTPIPPIVTSPFPEIPGFPKPPSGTVPEPEGWVLIASTAGAFLLARRWYRR